MTVDEEEVLQLAKDVEKLMQFPLYQKVIQELYIDKQAMSIGRGFEGSVDQLDTLKAISHLRAWLTQAIEDGKIILNNKG